MAREVHSFDVTIPAGTLKANPQVTDMKMPPREVREIEIIIPPGPRGLVGFQLAAAGVQMFPYEPGTFFVTDDEQIRWPVEGQISSGGWQLRAYNTGQFAHTLEIRFLVDLPEAPRPPERPALPSGLEVSRLAPAPSIPVGAAGARPLAHVGFDRV